MISIYVTFGEPRSIAKRHYELRLILMILQARKTRLARIWTRFYGADKNSSHEKLGLVDLVCKRRAGNTPRPPTSGPVGALANTTRTLSLSSNREKLCPGPFCIQQDSNITGVYTEKSCPAPFVYSKGVNITGAL